MLKTIIVTGLITISSVAAYTQPIGDPENRRKKIEAQKVAFITTELDLTPEEAQVFWPVYNQAQAEHREVRKKHGAGRDKRPAEGEPKKTIDTMTDKELEEKMDKMITREQAELDLRKKYLAKYKEVLPIKKVAKLYQSEKKFRKKLMSEIRGSGRDRYPDRARQKTKARF